MKKAFLFLIAIFAVNGIGLYYRWYLDYFWLDMVLHFLGGFFVAMFVAYYLKDNLKESKLKNLLILVGVTAFVGVVWEFAEYIANQTLTELIYNNFKIHAYFMGDLDDTISDLAMNILGAITFSFLHLFRRGKTHQVETNSQNNSY